MVDHVVTRFNNNGLGAVIVLLDTEFVEGKIQVFSAGEVSLRAATR